jgi:hypothetical protein
MLPGFGAHFKIASDIIKERILGVIPLSEERRLR